MQRDRHLASGDLRRHCQTKFCTACLRAGTRWSSTVFAHELPPRSASFEAENGLYLFALTMPGGGLNNRAENSHQPFRRRERALQRFRSMKTLQKFSSVHAQVLNHFNQERHLVTRQVYKQRRSAALAEWRALAA